MDPTAPPEQTAPRPRRSASVTALYEIERLALFGLVFAGYTVIGQMDVATNVVGHDLNTPLDLAIPFWTPAIFIYFLFWLFISIPFLWIKTRAYYRRSFWSSIFTLLIAFVVFVAFPTEIKRPSIETATSFSSYIVMTTYAGDPPFNCFPSLHVALSQICARSLLALDRRAGRFAFALAILISLSTLFVKQHFVADVVSGTLLAWGVHAATFDTYTRRRPPGPEDHFSNRVLLIPAALQIALFVYLFIQYRGSLHP